MNANSEMSFPNLERNRQGWRFVRRTGAVALVFVMLWLVLLSVLPAGKPVAQNQWSANRIRAERFLLSADTRTVLIGTSVTNRLPAAELEPELINLGMAGTHALDALELVAARRPLPAAVAIEINFLYWPGNPQYVADLLEPRQRWLLQHFPALRTENQPLNVVLRLIKHGRGEEDGLGVMLPEIRDPEVARNLIEMAAPPPEPGFANALARLESMVRTLNASGVRIGFYEMPLDYHLADSPRQRAARMELHRRYPESQWRWFELPTQTNWTTSDGLHLVGADLRTAARALHDAVVAW